MTNIVNEAATSNAGVTVNRNLFKLKIAGNVNCNIDIGMFITSNQVVRTLSKFETATDLQTIMKNAVDQAAKSEQKAVNDFLSLGFNSQKDSTTLQTDITNIIDTNIRNENLTSCNAVIDNINNGELEITGNLDCPTGINIAQQIASDQLAECISNTLINTILANETINQAVQNLESKQSAENKGITDFLKGLIVPLIIIGVIIVLIIIAKNVFTKSPQPYMTGISTVAYNRSRR